MKVARLNLLLLAILAAVVLTIAPSSASAIGANDSLPKPTVSGLPAATNLPAATFTISTTVSSTWFVDFGCAYDSPIITPCENVAYPTCAPAGGQHTCSQTISRFLTPGTHTFRFAAAYCDEPTIVECEMNDGFYASAIEVVTFVVERIPPIATIVSGPDFTNQVLKPGGSSFVFSANEAASFTCAFEGWESPAVPCVSPVIVPMGLKNGPHRFVVAATDAAGNTGRATQGFRVDVLHPKKCKKLKKGSSKSAKAKYKKCKAKNVADKKTWKKKHHLK